MSMDRYLKSVVFMITAFFLFSLCSAGLKEDISKIGSYVDEYKSGEITSAKMIVYLEYQKEKIYNTLDKEGKGAFSESEIKNVFEKQKDGSYEKYFPADSFEVVVSAYTQIQHDKDYYEKRDDEGEVEFLVDYYIRPKESTADTSGAGKELQSFASQLTSDAEKGSLSNPEEMQTKLFTIKNTLYSLSEEECRNLMDDVLELDTNRTKEQGENVYSVLIKKKMGEDCWPEQKCEDVCEERENCWEECHPEEVCNNGECHMEPSCEEVCETREECHPECHPEKHCEERIEGKLIIYGRCDEKNKGIWVEPQGMGFEQFQKVNHFDQSRNCEKRVEALVNVRKAFQDSVNTEFLRWYFEDFLTGGIEKASMESKGIERVLMILIDNEEQIADSLHCTENMNWPEGFEKIEAEYKKENVVAEIWEKEIPVEGSNSRYWTTLYKLAWLPEKEMVKEFIKYQFSNAIKAPDAEEIAEIKSDEGKMEYVVRLADKYGGSFDVKIQINDKEGVLAKKYIRINPDVVVKPQDTLSENEDISIQIDFDSFYNFLHYTALEMGGDEIRGPHWVQIEEGGPDKLFSVLGAVSKFWREGVNIQPKYALLKIAFNVKEMAELMMSA